MKRILLSTFCALVMIVVCCLAILPAFAYEPPTVGEWVSCKPDAVPNNANSLTMLDYERLNLGHSVYNDTVWYTFSIAGDIPAYVRVTTGIDSFMIKVYGLRMYVSYDSSSNTKAVFLYTGIGYNDKIFQYNNTAVEGGYIYMPGDLDPLPGFVVRVDESSLVIWYDELTQGNATLPNGFASVLNVFGDYEYRSQFVNTSYNEGYDRGYSKGRINGIAEGFDDGYGVGFTEGYEDGSKTTYPEAYDAGYNEAVKQIDSGDFGKNLLGNTFSASIEGLSNLVLVEAGGVRITVITVFATVIGITLFVWFLKMFAGG